MGLGLFLFAIGLAVIVILSQSQSSSGDTTSSPPSSTSGSVPSTTPPSTGGETVSEKEKTEYYVYYYDEYGTPRYFDWNKARANMAPYFPQKVYDPDEGRMIQVTREDIIDLVKKYCQKYNVYPGVVFAIIKNEDADYDLDAKCVNSATSVDYGLMQMNSYHAVTLMNNNRELPRLPTSVDADGDKYVNATGGQWLYVPAINLHFGIYNLDFCRTRALWAHPEYKEDEYKLFVEVTHRYHWGPNSDYATHDHEYAQNAVLNYKLFV